MTPATAKVLERAAKLKAMADHPGGNEHERATAQKLWDDLAGTYDLGSPDSAEPGWSVGVDYGFEGSATFYTGGRRTRSRANPFAREYTSSETPWGVPPQPRPAPDFTWDHGPEHGTSRPCEVAGYRWRYDRDRAQPAWVMEPKR